MIACNFHFNFIPKEILYVKNNSSKYELNLSAALRVPSTEYGGMWQKPLACHVQTTTLNG
jgi:hypothetical protein